MSDPSGSVPDDAEPDGALPDDALPDENAPGGAAPDGLEELRDAAGAVLASLKWLVDAAERVVEDPHAFDRVVATGRGIVEAFTSGLSAQDWSPPEDDEPDATL